MQIESAAWTAAGAIAAVIDGVSMSVPDDPGNRHRAAIAEWEAAGHAIAAYDPPPVRRLVPKSLVIARLTDTELDAALAAMTTRQRERWRAPDHPAIYADDPEAVALLTAIGADPATVLAP